MTCNNDILIFSKTREEHVMHVKKVLDILKKNQLSLKMSKYEFGKTSLVHLGHIVVLGVEPDFHPDSEILVLAGCITQEKCTPM